VVFDERHAEEIADPSGTAEAKFFVEMHRALEWFGGVQSNVGAMLPAKFRFGVGQQLGGDSRALAIWRNGHASEVAFAGADDLAGDGPDNLAGRVLGHENLHAGETILQCFGSEDGVEKSGGRVELAIRCEGSLEAGENLSSVVVDGAADGNFGSWRRCWHGLPGAKVTIGKRRVMAKRHFGFGWRAGAFREARNNEHKWRVETDNWGEGRPQACSISSDSSLSSLTCDARSHS
jgi:hypothetical protein